MPEMRAIWVPAAGRNSTAARVRGGRARAASASGRETGATRRKIIPKRLGNPSVLPSSIMLFIPQHRARAQTHWTGASISFSAPPIPPSARASICDHYVCCWLCPSVRPSVTRSSAILRADRGRACFANGFSSRRSGRQIPSSGMRTAAVAAVVSIRGQQNVGGSSPERTCSAAESDERGQLKVGASVFSRRARSPGRPEICGAARRGSRGHARMRASERAPIEKRQPPPRKWPSIYHGTFKWLAARIGPLQA